MPRSWVQMNVEEILRESDKAFLLVFEDHEGEFWIPKSHIHNSEEHSVGDTDCEVEITQWIAEQNELT